MIPDEPQPPIAPDEKPAEPLSSEALRQALDALAPGVRIDEVLAQMGLAFYSLGFARAAAPRLRKVENQLQGQARGAVKHLITCILQKVVIDAASTFDETGPGAMSLATALNLINRHLKISPGSPERAAALSLIREIRENALTKKSEELEYIRYLRNKWAAHATMDRAVDPWEDGKTIDFGKLEGGLEQMRQHFHSLATLIEMVTVLDHLEQDGRRIDESSVRMGLAWEGFSLIASPLMSSMGESAASELLDRVEPALIPHSST